MNKLIYININNQTYRVNIYAKSIQVIDSYKITKIKDIKCALSQIQAKLDYLCQDIDIECYMKVIEWRAHNLLYKLNVLTNHSKDVDLSSTESTIRNICYILLFPITFIFWR